MTMPRILTQTASLHVQQHTATAAHLELHRETKQFVLDSRYSTKEMKFVSFSRSEVGLYRMFLRTE